MARYPVQLPPRGQEGKVEGFTFSKSWTQMPTPSLPSSASSGPVSFLNAKLGMAVLALQKVREFNGSLIKEGVRNPLLLQEDLNSTLSLGGAFR